MKTNKKFTTESLVKFIIKSIQEIGFKDAEKIQIGLTLFSNILEEYMKDRYGSTKRLSDMREYEYIVRETLKELYKEKLKNK